MTHTGHTPGPYWSNYDNVNKQWRINGADGYGSIGAAYSESNAVMIVSALNAKATGKESAL